MYSIVWRFLVGTSPSQPPVVFEPFYGLSERYGKTLGLKYEDLRYAEYLEWDVDWRAPLSHY